MPVTDENGWSPPCPKDQLLPDTYRYKAGERRYICGNGHDYTRDEAYKAYRARNDEFIRELERMRKSTFWEHSHRGMGAFFSGHTRK